jgi:6-phospho-3-hexuloisomerase
MVERKVSREVGYINRIIENVKNIKRSEFGAFYDDLNAADCLILVGEGRSQSALYIGMWQLDKDIRTTVGIDFLGRNIKEVAPILEKKYNRIALLVNSGSGETGTPKHVVKQLLDYIERSKSNKFTLDAVVSNPNSSIGKIREKDYGNILELKGREKVSNTTTDEILKHGIMNDVYELGSLLLFQKTKEALNEKNGYETVFGKIEEESRIVGEIVDRFVSSNSYEQIVDEMEMRGRATIGGLGPARNVAKMTAIRLQHVKRAIGDEAYLSGPFAPRPRAGDILLLISWSGETDPVLRWCREHKEFGGHVYSIVGNESTLSKESESLIIESTPIAFYERATFALSPLPLHLVERLYQRGFKLPEYIMEWWEHSITQ